MGKSVARVNFVHLVQKVVDAVKKKSHFFPSNPADSSLKC